MTEQFDLSPLEIHTFSSMEEIRALTHFLENAPLSPANYKRLFGDYHLPEKVRCCVQKENGKLCEEPHNNGWLAERNDGKLTLVGIDCGVKKFGADRRLRDHVNHYLNEKKRLERIASLSEAIASKTERIEGLSKLQQEVKALEYRMRQATNSMGIQTMRRLKDMIKTRSYDVVITATIRREERGPDGRMKSENSTFQHRLGTLAGLELTSTGTFNAVYDTVNEIVRAYDQAEALMKEPDLRRKSKQINTAVNSLQDYDRIFQEGHRLLELERSFLGNDFFLFCFLSTDKAERVEAARIAMARSGKNIEKLAPADWLSRREEVIKEKLQAHHIAIR